MTRIQVSRTYILFILSIRVSNDIYALLDLEIREGRHPKTMCNGVSIMNVRESTKRTCKVAHSHTFSQFKLLWTIVGLVSSVRASPPKHFCAPKVSHPMGSTHPTRPHLTRRIPMIRKAYCLSPRVRLPPLQLHRVDSHPLYRLFPLKSPLPRCRLKAPKHRPPNQPMSFPSALQRHPVPCHFSSPSFRQRPLQSRNLKNGSSVRLLHLKTSLVGLKSFM